MVKVRRVKQGVRNWLGFTFVTSHKHIAISALCNSGSGINEPEEYEEYSEEFEIPVDWKPKNNRTFFG